MSTLLTESDVWNELECGQLSLPYVTVFGGSSPGAKAASERLRRVEGIESGGFADGRLLRQEFDAGATLKLSRIDHWHQPVRQVLEEISEVCGAGVVAHAFMSPPGDEHVITAHLDGVHVFILQCSGTKDWVAGYVDPDSPSGAVFCDHAAIVEGRHLRTRLNAGDVLYLPHGSPHYALARSEVSLHIAIEVQDPTPLEFLQAYCALVEASTWSHTAVAGTGDDAEGFRQAFSAGITRIPLDEVGQVAAALARGRATYPTHLVDASGVAASVRSEGLQP
ncbi:cupin domain-containing protein [Nonomuraea fuscirosea]|uniref:JmjC domain-containing protein n=1 Tax=Nonomuraea fuscirosea TaxID=1291556 RepID=UPI0034339BE9